MKNAIRGWAINKDKQSHITASEQLALLEESNHGRLDLETIKKYLNLVLPIDGQPDRQQVRDVIDVLGNPRILQKIIKLLLSDTTQLSNLKSFGHSTGMDRIELALHGKFSLRLHYWMSGDGECLTEDPHNHTYNFGSKVLSGTLVTDLFAQAKEGKKIGMYQIESQNSLKKPQPILIGEANIQKITPPDGIILTGDDPSYTMSHRAIHRIRKVDPKNPIITINLRGEAVKDKSNFFRDEQMQSASPTPTKVDVQHRLELLQRIFARIA